MTEDHMNTGLPVSGYKPQSDSSVALVNENKRLEEMILRRFDGLATIADDHPSYPLDVRWFAIARTHIEQGFMALNRAIFKPDRVKDI